MGRTEEFVVAQRHDAARELLVDIRPAVARQLVAARCPQAWGRPEEVERLLRIHISDPHSKHGGLDKGLSLPTEGHGDFVPHPHGCVYFHELRGIFIGGLCLLKVFLLLVAHDLRFAAAADWTVSGTLCRVGGPSRGQLFFGVGAPALFAVAAVLEGGVAAPDVLTVVYSQSWLALDGGRSSLVPGLSQVFMGGVEVALT